VATKLPPLAAPPRREVTPGERRRASGTFSLESDTPTRTRDTAQLGALVSVFERLTPKQRDQLAAIGERMAGMTDEQAERLLDFLGLR
jgi:hypothetical protein